MDEVRIDVMCGNHLQSNVTNSLHKLIPNATLSVNRLIHETVEIVFDTCPNCLNGAYVFYVSPFSPIHFLSDDEISDVFNVYDKLMLVEIMQLH